VDLEKAKMKEKLASAVEEWLKSRSTMNTGTQSTTKASVHAARINQLEHLQLNM
jgi:hypothetical protein